MTIYIVTMKREGSSRTEVLGAFVRFDDATAECAKHKMYATTAITTTTVK